MKKNIKLVLAGIAFAAFSCASATAFTFQWIPGITEEPPTSIGGYSVLDYQNAGNPWDSAGDNHWLIADNSNVSGSGSWALWIMTPDNLADGYLNVPSGAVAFAMEGDHNDGIAEFFVDGEYVTSQDLWNFGVQSLVVSGLDDSLKHVLSVWQTGRQNPESQGNHVHILGGAALGNAVPEGGATIAFLGVGLLGLAGLRRRF